MTSRATFAQGIGVGVVGTAAAVVIYKLLTTKRDVERQLPPTEATSEAILREQFSRNLAILGDDSFEKLQNAFVIVVGVGGVGSHAAHMLARAGVKRLRLIDFDQVTLSSLNRHAVAKLADVGRPKVTVLKEHLLAIVPSCEIEAIQEMFRGDAAEVLLAGQPSYVLDCIDNTETKVALVKYCRTHDIPVLCSMGAGGKLDPTRLAIADINETRLDPLSRQIRRLLKKEGIVDGVPTLFSSEIPSVKLQEIPDEMAADAEAFRQFPSFRVRIMPVLGTIPAMFGNAMASFVLRHIAGCPLMVSRPRDRVTFYHKQHTRLLSREHDRYQTPGPCAVSETDCSYLIDELWAGVSARSQVKNSLVLTRWNIRKPAATDNLILLTVHEAEVHDTVANLEEHYGAEFVAMVERKLAEERELCRQRALWRS